MRSETRVRCDYQLLRASGVIIDRVFVRPTSGTSYTTKYVSREYHITSSRIYPIMLQIYFCVLCVRCIFPATDLTGVRDTKYPQSEGNEDTIEKRLFHALTTTKLVEKIATGENYSRCGRTDRGVSALGNVS